MPFTGTPTPRLVLPQWNSLDDIEYAELNTTLLDLDTEIGANATTSTTRPGTGNYAGRLLYETDTKKLIRYTGSAWEYVSPVEGFTLNNIGGFNIVHYANARIRTDGKFDCSLYAQFIRTTSTFGLSATAFSNFGNVIPAAYRPSNNLYLPGTLFISTGNTFEPSLINLSPAGDVSVRATVARTMAASGTDFFTFTASWTSA